MIKEPVVRNLLCIVCPEGCEIEVRKEGDSLAFSGGTCRRGHEYAEQEIRNPSRILTTTVPVSGGDVAMLPVRTAEPVPKPMLMEIMADIQNISVDAPISSGDIVVPDIAGTGIPLLASRSIARCPV